MITAPSKTVIIVAGPTAVGKTAVAIQLALRLQTEIISADSRQCFREMTIGVARPSAEELATVPHHFIASHSVKEEVTAAVFEEYALQKTTELFQRHDTVVMVGGTGLYLKAFTEGLDKIPAIDPAIRERIIQAYEQNGLAWLQDQLQLADPVFFRQGEMQNPQRVMRALEVVEGTGQSITHFQQGGKTHRPFQIIQTGLELPKELLHQNIHTRVDHMMEQGLLQEVQSLYPVKEYNALKTVGYAELFEAIDKTISLEEAVDQIKTHTRQYAKRQLTWFKKNTAMQWFSPLEPDQYINQVLTQLK